MENRETPAPMPATDMTVKLFRAMSKASWDQVDACTWWHLLGCLQTSSQNQSHTETVRLLC